MAFNKLNSLESLEEQIFSYRPTLKTKEQKENVRKRLRHQLVDSKAVVRIQRMDAECESLMISLKQRLQLLQDILIPKDRRKQAIADQQPKDNNDEMQDEIVNLNLSSDSSDEETLSSLMSKSRETPRSKTKMYKKSKTCIEHQQVDTSEQTETELPLALRRKPRERKLSYKSLSSSASTSHSKHQLSKLQNKQDHSVTTSGVAFHSEELLVEQEEMDTTPTLHIKIPSLHRGNVHYIILDSLNFARKVFDYRANEVKLQQQQQHQHSSITHSTKISKTRKKQMKTLTTTTDPALQQLSQQEHELELSQLIQDVMAEACNEETLQATNALENINNNLIDNYESIAQDNLITYSQSSQEISYSQNSNTIETVCSTSGLPKKLRKNNNKRKNEQCDQQLIEPPRKKGRKVKKKNDANDMQPQPPTKSNLAKYVEFFANDCELLPGSTTPAASSTRSLPLVSSTTQNFEVIDQLPKHQDQQTSPPQQQHPITYYIDGDWANGGPCQLVATNGMSVDARQLNQDDMNAPFQDFVNYIDNSSDSGNNVIARVLEANHSLPISINLPIANIGIQNKSLQQRQQIIQNSVPVINIQIPSLPSTITSPTAPPPAHSHKDVLDLSMKSKSNFNLNNNEVLNLQKSNNTQTSGFMAQENDDYCIPLDLSAKGCNATTNISNVTIDNHDEDFIRRLIEQSDFAYTGEALKKVDDNERTDLVYDHENEKSFKAALDMPLLDFDANDLAVLVENNQTESNKQPENLTDTNNEDSNYVSMTADNTTLNFSDQSTSDIFNKLLDICPDNQFLDNINNEFTTNDDLNESIFDQCRVENSIQSIKKPLEEKEKKDICDTTQNNEKTNKEHNSSNETTSTSFEVQTDSSNNMSVTSEVSLNLKCSVNKMITDELKNHNLEEETQNLEECEVIVLKEKSSIKDKPKEHHKTTLNNYLENSESLKKYQQIKDKTTKESLSSNNNLEKAKPTENIKDMEIIENITSHTNNNSRNNSAVKNDNIKPDIPKPCSSNNNLIKDDECIKPNEHKVIDIQDTKNKINKKENKPVLNYTQMKNKTKDNVVFSVKKITLTEDENLFTTDSDASSGKSSDINDDEPKENDDKKDTTEGDASSGKSLDTNDDKPNENDDENKVITNFEQNVELKGQDTKDIENVLNYHKNIKENSSQITKLKNVNKNDVVEAKNDIRLKSPVNDYKNSCKINEKNDFNIKPIEINENCSTEVINLKTPTINDNENSCETFEHDDSDILILKESESFCNEVINLSMTSKHDNSENSTQDLIIYNLDNEDSNTEKSQDVQQNIKSHETEIVTDRNFNYTNDEMYKDGKKNSLDLSNVSQKLTLLELESKLEASLDFEEDYDDTLSLATSCFNSPNDERFEDSIVINDTTTPTNAATTKPIEILNNDNDNLQISANKDLKHFKIPKITHLTTKDNNSDTTTLKENESSNIIEKTKNNEPPAPTTSLPKITTVPLNLKKIIRTVKNDLVETNHNFIDITPITPSLQHEIPNVTNIIQQVFGITCLPFLVNKCYAITHCQLSHQFHDTDTVYKHLNTLDKSNVNVIYQIMYNHAKLFKLYFKVFCTYYTTKNDRVKLLNMVNDCERYPEYGGEFLIVIYESLVNCGLNRVNACRLILKCIRETTSATTILEALVAIIMKSDWTMFTDFIEKYTQEVYKFNYRIAILEQMAPAVLNSKGPHLKQIFGKCVQTLHCDDTGLLLNSPILIQCVALLTTNT